MQTIFDPLRKKHVALTPEEKVRQWCIQTLSSQCGVPLHMMMSEAGLTLGAKRFRADLIVYDRNIRPLMVVECKRPEVELSPEVLDQAIRYNMVLNVRYILITNGLRTCVCRRAGTQDNVRYVFADSVPTYEEMLCQQQ